MVLKAQQVYKYTKNNLLDFFALHKRVRKANKHH